MKTIIIDRSHHETTSTIESEERLKQRVEVKVNEELERILAERDVTDLAKGTAIRVKIKLDEPSFRYNRRTGHPRYVVIGNDRHVVGDIIQKPSGANGTGIHGTNASFGEGEDEFVFELSPDAVTEHLFEGLGLPNMEERVLQVRTVTTTQRAGLQSHGPAALLDRDRSFGNAMARRHAFSRPSTAEVEELEREIARLSVLAEDDVRRKALPELECKLERARKKRVIIPYFEPGDLRFRKIEAVEERISAAVVFCLMDVSGSMTQKLKDLGKRFFWLLKALLEREYREVSIVFIRHTDTAQEVDEHTFFYDPRTGGTAVLPALQEMLRIRRERFPLDQYNVYVCQAGDGETWQDGSGRDDARESAALLRAEVLPIAQFVAYLECREQQGKKHQSPLWAAYRSLEDVPHFAKAYAGSPKDIWPVFSGLFRLSEAESRKRAQADKAS